MTAPPPDLIAALADRYRLEREVGAGGMAHSTRCTYAESTVGNAGRWTVAAPAGHRAVTAYPDLGECRYFVHTEGLEPSDGPTGLRAVGWLDDTLPTAPTDLTSIEPVLDALVAIWQAQVDPWGTAMGRHGCGLCGVPPDRAPATVVVHKGQVMRLGSGFITVPGAGFLYIAPSLVIHYITAHGYRPPDEFCAAVLACPKPRTRAYRRALLREGPPELATREAFDAGAWRYWVVRRLGPRLHQQNLIGRLLRWWVVRR